MNIDTRHPFRIALVGVILPTLAIALVALVATIAEASTRPDFNGPHYAASQVGAEVCFPFHAWSQYSIDDAPCDTLPAPQEDGSGRLYLGTVANDLAECVIPNPREERGAFVIHCHRLGRGTR